MNGAKMGTKFEEKLSALVDNELTSFESRRLINELANDPVLKSRWGRYHLMGDLMRGEVYLEAENNFAAGVMSRINEEAVPEVSSRNKNAWLKPMTGVAIVASVAVVSLFSLKNITNEGGFTSEQMVTVGETAPANSPVASSTTAPGNSMVQPVSVENPAVVDPEGKIDPLQRISSEPRMNSYLATHAEFAARPGIMPRVRVVGFEADTK
jgi:sigma-E factor negative regulatory protein RseA